MSENTNSIEIHGCLVCARLFNVLAVYTPDNKLVDCAVTSPSGHCLPNEHQPLVACDIHTEDEIESAHKRWQSMNIKGADDKQDDE